MPDLGGRIRSAESKEFRIPLPILEIRHLEGFRPPKAEALRTLRDATSALVEFVMKAVPEELLPLATNLSLNAMWSRSIQLDLNNR